MERRQRRGGANNNSNGVKLLLNSRQRQQRSSRSHLRSGQASSIVSPWKIVGIVTFCLGAGFLQYHYRKSRAQDPFLLENNTLGGGLPKFIRNMVQAKNEALEALQLQQQQQPHEKEEHPKQEQDQQQQQHSSSNDRTNNNNNLKFSLLTPEEDSRLETDSDGIRYHLIFSTDCSPYQHWQSYLVYFTAMLVRQPGHVTRIASGCNPEESKVITEWFQRHIQHMSPRRFHLQLTPHFSSVTNGQGQTTGDYKFFNKPFGLKYWMEHSPQLNFNRNNNDNNKETFFPESVHNDIVILIDPDMGLMRPITRDFTHDENTVFTPKRKPRILTRTVGPGKPIAQVYGFGAQWARLNLTKITNSTDSPALKVSLEEGAFYYSVGPPYLATLLDMYQIALKWTEFVPRVYQQHPHLLAEMFGFCIAAAHLKLPHQGISSLMVSDLALNDAEGWPLIDPWPAQQVCTRAQSLVSFSSNMTQIPNVVHMCQRYGLGSQWFFSKHAIPEAFIYDCQAPLFEEPPPDVATLYNFKQLPPVLEIKPLSPSEAHRMAFMLCYLFRLLNEAATFYKQNACSSEQLPNLQKTMNLADFVKDRKHDKNKKK